MPTRAGAEPGWSWEHNPVFPHGCFSSTALLEAKIRRPRLEPTQSSMGHWCPNSYLTTAPNASGERLPNTDVQGKINQLPDYNEKLLFKNPSCGERYSEHMYPVKDCYQWASARGGVQSVWLLLMRERQERVQSVWVKAKWYKRNRQKTRMTTSWERNTKWPSNMKRCLT